MLSGVFERCLQFEELIKGMSWFQQSWLKESKYKYTVLYQTTERTWKSSCVWLNVNFVQQDGCRETNNQVTPFFIQRKTIRPRCRSSAAMLSRGFQQGVWRMPRWGRADNRSCENEMPRFSDLFIKWKIDPKFSVTCCDDTPMFHISYTLLWRAGPGCSNVG